MGGGWDARRSAVRSGEIPDPGRRLLGVVLAGGEGRRFGGEKALAALAGRPMAAWGLEALAGQVAVVGVVANAPEVARVLGVAVRPDRVPGLGPLGGLLTALAWARDQGLEGAFVLACDLPLVREALVAGILARWPAGAAAVVPESPGPLGFEPLCAAYSVDCLPTVETWVASGRRAMQGLLGELEACRVPARELGGTGALTRAFTNVNTRAEAAQVESMLESLGKGERP